MVWARMLGEDGNGTVCGIVIIELFCGDAKDCIVGEEYDIDANPSYSRAYTLEASALLPCVQIAVR